MAELALAAIASMGIGGTAATAAGAAGAALIPGIGAAAAAGTAATGLSTVLSILSGVASVAGILGTLNAGAEDARQAELLGDEAELEAGQTQLAGEQRRNQMRRELFKVLGENRVSLAAAGIDVGGGIADQSRGDSVNRATRELSIDRRDDDLRRAMYRARAAGYRRSASSARGGALLKAAGGIASYGISLAERG